MFSTFARTASAAFCSLILTAVAVGSAVDAQAATGVAAAVYASAVGGESADV